MTEAKYKKIETILKQRIIDQTYPLNSLLPKELELAQEFKTSRPTINHAIHNLVQEGLLEQRKRLGTIVRRNKIQQEFTHLIQSYNQEMSTKGLKTKTKVLYFQKVVPNSEVQTEFNISTSDSVFKLIRLRYVDNHPIVKVTTYVPVSLVPDLEKINFSTASLYLELKKRNLAVTHVVRKLEVKKASSEIAQKLAIKENDPVFCFRTRGYTNKDQKIEYSIDTYRGDMNSFIIDLKR